MENLLSTPFTLPCGEVIHNRLVKAAMTERVADNHNGPTELHQQLYDRWADTGAGLLITGNVMVDRVNLESAGNVCFDHEDIIPTLKPWVEAGRKNGAHLWTQISHAGRQTSRFSTSRPKAPSAVQLKRLGLFGTPEAMSEEDIEATINGYVKAATISQQAGFTGVQIHSAHGYLMSQFLSPLTNLRTDKWGGTIDNRCRILTTIVERIREATGPSFPISVKINSSDFQRGGFSEEDSLYVIGKLSELGIDLIEVSGGTYEQSKFLLMNARDSTRKREAYFIEFAQKVREISSVPLMVTGGFRTHRFCNQVLNDGQCDFIGMARPFLTAIEQINGFIRGEVEALETPVVRTGIKLFENAAEGGYHARQLIRLAKGKNYDKSMKALPSASFLILYEFLKSIQRS